MSGRRTRRSRGFTMVELLVVMAIIAVGLALAGPAIEQARQAARARQCINHLKQIGLAIHNYHDAHRTFPPGWVAPDAKAKTDRLWGWQASLLPFVEQAPLYNRINFSGKIPRLSALSQTTLPIYRCPDDTTSATNPIRGTSANNPVRGKYATSNYSGNWGNTTLPGSRDTPKKANGVFYWNSRVRMRDITDGTSNTFMVGERSVSSAAGIWVGLRANQNENDAVTDCSHESRPNAVMSAFSSKHPGGAHFLFCDGRVRFLSDKIGSSNKKGGQMGIYQRLSQRNDGQVVGEY